MEMLLLQPCMALRGDGNLRRRLVQERYKGALGGLAAPHRHVRTNTMCRGSATIAFHTNGEELGCLVKQ
jgi:hypothetical protein